MSERKSQFNFLRNVVNVFKWDGKYDIYFFILFGNKWLEASVCLTFLFEICYLALEKIIISNRFVTVYIEIDMYYVESLWLQAKTPDSLDYRVLDYHVW